MQNLHLQDELSKIMEELAEEKKSCADLGDLNTALSNQNIQLTEQLQSTKVHACSYYWCWSLHAKWVYSDLANQLHQSETLGNFMLALGKFPQFIDLIKTL